MKRRSSPKTKYPTPPFPKQHQPAPGFESKLDPAPLWRGRNYRPAGKLQDRVALITGGDSGIGRAVAFFFAREGADVAIAYLRQEQGDAVVVQQAVEALGRTCLLLPTDLTDPDAADELVRQTIKTFGRLDILVSNAAHQARKSTLEKVDDAELAKTFETNVYGYVRLVRAALPHLKPGAAVIATSSETGILGAEQLPDYSSTKGAINALTKTMAMDLIAKGIRENAVAPGPVWTPLNPSDAGASAKKVSRFGQQSPMGRPAQPEELAPAYVFLASNADSSYITGTIIQVMGGETTGG